MKKLDNNAKNILYLLYRLVKPILDPVKFVLGFYGYVWYLRDLIVFKVKSIKVKNNKNKQNAISVINLYPVLDEKTTFTSFDAHYFFQQLWVFESVLSAKPSVHVDVGSTYELSGYLSKIVKTKFIDIRPIDTHLKNLEVIKGNILNLPIKDASIESLSCLHVIEHIGLGRYGDTVDPEGIKKACSELGRVLAPNGLLYLSTPIGKDRVCFNAHRVNSPNKIPSYFEKLKLIQFNIVDDNGNYLQDVNPNDFEDLNYGCGMFLFKKI